MVSTNSENTMIYKLYIFLRIFLCMQLMEVKFSQYIYIYIYIYIQGSLNLGDNFFPSFHLKISPITYYYHLINILWYHYNPLVHWTTRVIYYLCHYNANGLLVLKWDMLNCFIQILSVVKSVMEIHVAFWHFSILSLEFKGTTFTIEHHWVWWIWKYRFC